MKIAIISDIHDHLRCLRESLARARALEAGAVICCGDLCSPFIARELGLGFPGPVHVVFGNNDGDQFHIAANAKKFPHLQFYGAYAELELDGRRFAVNHYDQIGQALARNGQFDVVCFGHNHRFEITPVGQTLIINPGELFGGLTGSATFAIYDTRTHQAMRIDLAA